MNDDDRAEQAFRDALGTHADALEPEMLSPDPVPRRGRTWPVVLTAAAAVLVLAVGTLVWRAAVSGDGGTTAATSLPDGWRWESYRDVMVAVPGSWGYAYAPRDQWCTGYNADGKPQNPRILPLPAQGYVDTRLPGDASTLVLCAGGDVPPEAVFVVHLSFLDANESAAAVPAGWANVTRTVGNVRLDVVTDPEHQDLAGRVLGTAHVFSTDQNGCDTTSPFQAANAVRPDPAFDVTKLAAVDSIVVCQYLLGAGTGPSLVASQMLTGAAAQSELTAIQQAPPRSGPNRPRDCYPSDTGERASVLHLNAGKATHELYARYSGCADNGIDDGTHVRELTRADCVPLSDARIHVSDGLESVFRRCVADFPSRR
jgi:hypothetical protein